MDLESVYQSADFGCTPCRDCDVPGYLILFALPGVDAVGDMRPNQLANLGKVLALLERAVAMAVKAEKIYILRFSEGTSSVHFHIFPRTADLAAAYRQAHPDSKALIGEDIYGWARLHYRTELLSEVTQKTAAQIRLSLHRNRISLLPRASRAFKDTYGFEAPERQEQTQKFSLFIWAPAAIIFLAKFLWGVELVRFLARWHFTQPDPVEVHPVISDIYTLAMLCVTAAGVFAVGFGIPVSPEVLVIYGLWRIFEAVGASFHALISRAVIGRRKSRSEFRYLIATIVRSVETWAALTLIWGAERDLLVASFSMGAVKSLSMLQVAYFVMTSISTVGYGDIVPNASKPLALSFAILTQFVALAMFAMLVAKAVSLVAPRIGPVGPVDTSR